MSGWPLPSRSRPIEWIVHFEPGSVSFGLDCQAGLPLAKMMARSSPPPLGARDHGVEFVQGLGARGVETFLFEPRRRAGVLRERDGGECQRRRPSQRNMLRCMVAPPTFCAR